MHKSLKLSEFLELIKSTIEISFGYDGFWIVAELSEWRASGKHYYGELIEHDGASKYPVAKIRCNCWANVASYINDKFSAITGELLKSDMKVLLKVAVNYHISFGLSLNIIDIDPSYTLGDRQARKLEILEQLAKKGILDKNKKLQLPKDFTNIAVITSFTAAGKGDFFEEADKLQSLRLCQFDIYEAKMQGKDCVVSVSKAFDKIANSYSEYDAIVLIRGGGSQADLDWFNNILLAENICNSTLPVMIGIGHERDSTVLDDICTKRFDTPSKVINFITKSIIDNAAQAKYNYDSIIRTIKVLAKQKNGELDTLYTSLKTKLNHYLQHLEQTIHHHYKSTLATSNGVIKLYSQSLDAQYKTLLSSTKNLTKYYGYKLDEYYSQSIQNTKHYLSFYSRSNEYLYKQILSLAIQPTLRRGFSLTKMINGEYVTTKKQAQSQVSLEVIYYDGKIKVEVEKNGNTE
ncbi:exodeoxyribonuclease VII large subunit [Allofrancisella guangzhouensis]|uniref:Exodeoxyribonuclease 7 large subunit n=1 Tax=Allofrancisella guangzhouensis TaxID=594679 RepID=A0A0A8E478_9GAMM|nr:exodeoxyribonuclease VII large subunit [Allofrancisella guangzhouensis]AJC49010.1 exodeoxyribonuclease VII large subunit [Allofrancisella guangzhouensis]MBK2027561.1 exodeoxyribonuclease VII large subunit [Allofrancisella guangzhouensis]MBK2044462.1 exodeoxyribonuclease VII large subunit [Allofrancisella guangzhouensis]MBK2046099.1 exodeoxyribonuclease VII large subunit [Allofrancisella guangzhouensis]